ncbi:MAG: 5-dehydro-4-deoxy-D-glucuronate isomerase [Synergistaceae bacterium]|jgi:4-deoxy-L-threo-5-hexosulose-uronate ketol-isomerase|nr:5-dehydro-4-deoxy-D-glucuronate isomerase [Synergistaceae bacterium]
MSMEVRYAANPADAKRYDTRQLREEFLVETLFKPGEIVLVYSHVDRMIVGSACPAGAGRGGEGPAEELSLTAGKELGGEYFLERREMAALNLGGKGTVRADGREYELEKHDALYIGMGTKSISFGGAGSKFYILSSPAHQTYPTTRVTLEMAVKSHVGSKKDANERTINKYLDPSVVRTCQLAMGMTALEEGCVWNTMPSHTHERRMEVYLYLNLPQDAFVVHLMGEPKETRHIVVRDGQAVISPSWSVHSGVGTCAYTFVWGMCGENQTYSDMDLIAMRDLR